MADAPSAAVPATVAPAGIDPRGPRFAAGITSVVLAVTVLTGSVWLLAAQVAVFAVGSLFGVQRSPYAWLYRRAVRPRLGPPAELEDPAPPRFAQTVGLTVTGIALLLAIAGVEDVVRAGASYDRQRAVADAAGGDLSVVVKSLVAELRAGRPLG